MLRHRPACVRGLRLYHAGSPGAADPPAPARPAMEAMAQPDTACLHARSRFRAVLDAERFAVYTVREAEPDDGRALRSPVEAWVGEHTLSVVREFRRVPLHASALALALFTARPGRSASVVAALAHFVEQAVSLYQPSYLLLAHSRETPWISALLMGVHECAALAAASPVAFSLDRLLPELRPMLATDPEWYAYDPEPERAPASSAVSPNAV